MTSNNYDKQIYPTKFLHTLKSTYQWVANLVQIRTTTIKYSLFLSLSFALQATIAITAHGATYYVSKSGSGSLCSEANPCSTISAGISAMSGGDTLIIGDGTYTDEEIRNVPSGSAGAYSTVQAENVGGVNVRWTKSHTAYTYPCFLSYKSYIKIDGILFDSGSNSDAVFIYTSDHIKITRCGGTIGTYTGNTHVFNANESSYVLFENCWAYGGSRYKFLAYHSDYVVFRRCVSRHDYMADAKDGSGWHTQCALFTTYDSDNTVFQNCIGLDSGTDSTYVDSRGYAVPLYGQLYGGIWSENNETAIHPVQADSSLFINLKGIYLGTIYDPKLYDVTRSWSDIIMWDVGGGVDWTNVTISGGTYYSVAPRNWTIGDVESTYTSPAVGASAKNTNGLHSVTATIRDSIFYKIDGTAIANLMVSDYNSFYENTSNGTVGSNSITDVDPTSASLLYLPRIESGSALASAGESGGQIGAEIMWKIGVDGTLYGESGWNTIRNASNGYGGDNDKLWPFPYEDVIKADMQSYDGPGPSGDRGFASSTALQLDRETPITLTSYIWEYLGNQMPNDIYSSSSNSTSSSSSIYYVRTDGSDSQNGTSNTSGEAWKTLQYAADHVEAGDTVLVADGTYAGFYVNDGGSSGSPKTFQCLGSACEITSSHSGVYADAGINVEGASVDYVTIDGFTIHGVSGRGIRLIGGTGNIVKNCLIYSNTRDGILTGNTPYAKILDNTVYSNGSVYLEHNIYVSNPLSDHVIIRGNIVHDANYGNGIQINGENGGGPLDHSDYATIEDNISYNNASNGIKIIASNYATVQNNVIRGNGNAAGGIHIVHQNGSYSTANTVVNNTIDEPNMACVRINSENTNNVVFNNICIGSRGIVFEGIGNYNSNNFMVSSSGNQFIDIENRDYHLASDSSAIGYGVTLYQSRIAPTVDKDGNARSVSYDAGAYEYGTAYNTNLLPPTNLRVVD